MVFLSPGVISKKVIKLISVAPRIFIASEHHQIHRINIAQQMARWSALLCGKKGIKKIMGCCNLQVTAAGSHINTEEMQWRRFVRKPDRKSSANLGIVTQSYPSPTVTSRSEVIIICPNSIVKCHNLRLEGQTSSVFKSTSSLRTILYIPLFPFKKPKLL